MFEGGAFAVYLNKEHGMVELRRETLHDKTIRIVPDPDPMNPCRVRHVGHDDLLASPL